MAIVELSNGMSSEIDDDDMPLVAGRVWHAKRSSSKQGRHYAVCHDGNRHLYMHRLIVGAASGEIVDHIDRNTLDNRRVNLRICNAYENTLNKVGWGSLGIKGVAWDASHGRFKAYINVDGERIYLGNYADIDEAISIRDEAAIRYHGEFAVTSKNDDRAIINAKGIRAKWMSDRSKALATKRAPAAEKRNTIIALRKSGMLFADIARAVGVSQQYASIICKRSAA